MQTAVRVYLVGLKQLKSEFFILLIQRENTEEIILSFLIWNNLDCGGTPELCNLASADPHCLCHAVLGHNIVEDIYNLKDHAVEHVS